MKKYIVRIVDLFKDVFGTSLSKEVPTELPPITTPKKSELPIDDEFRLEPPKSAEEDLFSSTSYDSFVAGLSVDEFQANALLQNCRRLRMIGRSDKSEIVARELLRKFPSSDAARRLRKI